MKTKDIKLLLLEGKKVATKEMRENGDYLKLKDDRCTVFYSWGGNFNFIGDKYQNTDTTTWETI